MTTMVWANILNQWVDSQGEIKNRYIDLREFDSLKKHLNWLTFFEDKNPFEK
jgi:hypothetical protein